jgi:prepilin peptidase CpaA
MNGEPLVIVAALLGVLLVIAAVFDLRERIIPNRLNLAIALLAPLAWWAQGLALWPDIALQIGVAALIFALFIGLFAIGGIGGGDVKMIGALALWIDAGLIVDLLMIMALVGGVIAGGMLIYRKMRKTTDKAEVPYGVAIAIAGLWAVHQQYLNHFPIIPVT